MRKIIYLCVCALIVACYFRIESPVIKSRIAISKGLDSAIGKIKTTPEFQEKFIGKSEKDFWFLYNFIKRNKPESKNARGISNANGLIYIAGEDGGFYFVAPLGELLSWKRYEKKWYSL
jgi:hypothetical protein